MHIFILRHGEAGFALKDRDRNLTEHGIAQIDSQAKFLLNYLKQHNLNIDKALISPYARAQESFKVLQQCFTNNAVTLRDMSETCDLLTPSGMTTKVIYKINELYNDGVKNLLIVSHLPLVDNLVYELVNQDKINYDVIYFNTASMAIVKYNEVKNDLLGIFHPKNS